MPGYKKERKDYIRYDDTDKMKARNIDVVNFLESAEGFSFKAVGNTFRCEQHDSLVVQQDRKRWYWNSQGVGGNNVIDYLMSVKNYTYIEAMKVAVGDSSVEYKPAQITKKVKQEKKLKLPNKSENGYKRIFGYLVKSRGIDSEIVQDCVDKKMLYQDEKNNCVFVGFDENKQAKFACLRGTVTKKPDSPYLIDKQDPSKLNVFDVKNSGQSLDNFLKANTSIKKISVCLDTEKDNAIELDFVKKYKELDYAVSTRELKYRGDCYGSDKAYAFRMEGTDKSKVYVFESPIDAMSHATLTKLSAKEKGRSDWQTSWQSHERISLSGTSDVALAHYLTVNPQVKKIIFCLDNDEAGRENTMEHMEKYKKLGYEVKAQIPKANDFNDDLKSFLDKKNNQNIKPGMKAEGLQQGRTL